jgi:GTP-binding protein
MGVVVAIDGPSGAGKSSTAKALALRAGWEYLDTGALYRGVTWLALRDNLTEAREILLALENSPFTFAGADSNPTLFVGGVDCTAEIRSAQVTERVSEISAMPEIRQVLLALQRKIIAGAHRGIVVEGRDIGTVVAPEAGLKVFLTAELSIRAQRRDRETASLGATSLVTDVQGSLDRRDRLDTGRVSSPLECAPDAIVID